MRKLFITMTTALAVVLAVLTIGTAPAVADEGSGQSTVVVHKTVAPVVARHKPFHHTHYMASSWCGSWLRGPMWCVNFGRTEQGYLSAISLASAATFICHAGIIACAIAVAIAAALQRYVDNHGICPSTRPILEVEYAPIPGGYAACSNG